MLNRWIFSEKYGGKLSVALVLLMLVHILSPIVPSQELVEQDNNQMDVAKNPPTTDIVLEPLQWISGSYFNVGAGAAILSAGVQQVLVTVRNDGPHTAIIELDYAGSFAFQPSIFANQIGCDAATYELAGNSQQQCVIQWDAVESQYGQFDVQIAMAGSSPSTDSDSSNNAQSNILFEVNSEANVIVDTPDIDDRLPLGLWDLEISSINLGNMETSVDFEVNLSDCNGPEFTYSSLNLSSNSISQPSQYEFIQIEVNSTSVDSGSCDITVYWSYEGIESNLEISAVFSDYRAAILAPSDRAVEPGNSAVLTFIVQNLGAGDTFEYSVTSMKGWATNVTAQQINVASLGSSLVSVGVQLPIETNRSEIDRIDLQIVSQTEFYSVDATAFVYAGDLLQATLNHSSWNVNVTPGQPENIQYILKNNGTSPAVFTIDCGFSQLAPGWSVTAHPSTTPYLSVGEEITVSITVTPPQLTLPLDPSSKLVEGNTLRLWTAVAPEIGGEPVIQHTFLHVQATIMVELMAENTEFFMPAIDVFDNRVWTNPVELEMQVRHNLITNPDTTVNVELDIAPSSFEATRSGNGLNEANRWSTEITPENSVLSLGATQMIVANLGSPDPGSDSIRLPPVAGILEVEVTASLTIESGLSGIESPVSRVILTVNIPEVSKASIEIPSPTIITPEIETSVPVNVVNLGNHESNLSYILSGPLGWSVSSQPTTSTSVPSNSDQFPTINGDNIEQIMVSATAPPNYRADADSDVMLQVIDESGNVIAQELLPFEIQELVGATLLPANATANVSVDELELLPLLVTNIGNSLQQFDVSVEGFSEHIDVNVASSSSITLLPGENRTVEINILANPFARADANHSARVTLSNDGDLVAQTLVHIHVNPFHNITFGYDENVSVVPGQNFSMVFDVTNNGNLVEFIEFDFAIIGGSDEWVYEIEPENLTLEPAGTETKSITLSIQVPAAGGNDNLESGDINYGTMVATNVTDNLTVGEADVEFFTDSVFQVDWNAPNIIKLRPYESRDFTVEVVNRGNLDVQLDVICTAGDETRWLVSNCDLQNLTLPMGEMKNIEFTVQSIAGSAWNLEETKLNLKFSPLDDDLGDRDLESTLQIARIWTEDEYLAVPDKIYNTFTIDIPWTNVLEQGIAGTQTDSYVLELVGSERFINESLYVGAGDIEWEFTVDPVTWGQPEVLNLNGETYLLGPTPSSENRTLRLRIKMPAIENLPPGDGYSLDFNLIHPSTGDNNITSFNVRVISDSWADPGIISVNIEMGSEISESTSGVVSAMIKNHGNNTLPDDAVAVIECEDGIEIIGSEEQSIAGLGKGGIKSVNWDVQTGALNWWETSKDVHCNVVIQSTEMYGNQPDDDALRETFTLNSWSPPLLILIPITLGLILLCSQLLRRSRDDDRSLMLSAYAGCALLGVSTHYGLGAIPNIVMSFASIVWLALITRSAASHEFPAILSDRQNLLRGGSSLVEDHEGELVRVANQLRVKLSLAPLGFIFMVLILPNEISWSEGNIASIFLYLMLCALSVELTIRNSTSSWNQIFEELTFFEGEARGLLVQLGNPSTELRKITIGQRWGDSHDVSVEVEGNV